VTVYLAISTDFGPTIQFADQPSSPKLKPSRQCSLCVPPAVTIRCTSSIAARDRRPALMAHTDESDPTNLFDRS